MAEVEPGTIRAERLAVGPQGDPDRGRGLIQPQTQQLPQAGTAEQEQVAVGAPPVGLQPPELFGRQAAKQLGPALRAEGTRMAEQQQPWGIAGILPELPGRNRRQDLIAPPGHGLETASGAWGVHAAAMGCRSRRSAAMVGRS